MLDELTTQLREASAPFTPTEDERARVTHAVHEHMSAPEASPRPARTRRRTWWAVAATTAAGAAAIVIAIASTPSDSNSDRGGFTRALTASSALANASEAAASGNNSPLGTDEWFHVYSTTFEPDNSAFENDPGFQNYSGMFGNVSGFESWLDRRGRGVVLNITGGGPNVTAQVTRHPKTGVITSMGMGTRPLKQGELVTVAESLRRPAGVSVTSWPRDGSAATATNWLDAGRDELELAGQRDLAEISGTIPMDAAGNQKQFWSVPITEIDKLTGSGAELDRQIEHLLETFLADSPYRSNRIPTGTYGITAASKDREESIEHVVRMLGMAPVAPRARQALFQWLARQPSAKFEGPTKDKLGRTGTGVRFETVYDEQIPAQRLTAAQLVANARGAGVTDVRPVTSAAIYNVKAHREFRRWSVRLIFDEETGQVLQSQSYSSQTSTGATVPMLMVDQKGGTRVLAQGDQMNSAGAQLFIERGRTTSIEPASPVCKTQPEVCKP